MSEWPHSHSDQSKARISLALKKIWHESLKLKRLQEKLYCSWTRYIAEAAKRGGEDQRELGWDSFHQINAELNIQYLQKRDEKAKARETAKLRAEKVAKDRAEKFAQRRKKKEEQAQAKILSLPNSFNRKKKGTLVRDLKLIKRLTKYRKKMVIPVSSSKASSVEPQASMEKLDLAFIKAKKIQSFSLVDQLQTLKSKKEVCSELL